MTPAELVADLEARGALLEPVGRDRLAVEPVDLLTPEELEALRRSKPAVLRLLRQRHRLSPWPDSIGGHRRVVGPLDRCAHCPPDPPPPRTALAQSRTWCRYGGEMLCLAHALQREAAERRPS